MRKKILVADDDVAVVNVLYLRLSNSGYDVIKCYNGDEALKNHELLKPDLLILDINMPGKNGLQVCQELRGKGFELPIIMLTGRSSESDRFWGSNIGANAYITKPYSSEELLDKINELLNQ